MHAAARLLRGVEGSCASSIRNAAGAAVRRLPRAAAVALITSATLAACGPTGPQLTEERVRSVAENMATAWSDCDHVAFSRDWTDELRSQSGPGSPLDVAAWTTWCEAHVLISGEFVSVESLDFTPAGGTDTERWNVTIAFENETDVLTLVLRREDGRVDHFNEFFGQTLN